ncbi:M15 family metallopeptidase [Aureimonas leprariae]|uniref:D-alanyl-D-alanine carboxypeptidase-like core domain-containing protein n=1 Tax=Plantimonas leprariae TaxID=2615207 RepID=A0A7V7PMB3_9HYPH|nr:M15 family metallopeptidase [Aureimonas leprariae]KAB0678049.1 hypothetical protein F6X38_16620 [Aureimonas leprariae]
MAFDWSRYAVGGATRPDSFTGMRPEFREALERMFIAAPPELGLQVGSGYRSVERQRQLWEASDKSGRMVARPGGSRHNHGDAADLSASGLRLDKASAAARDWVHQNAGAYGLSFPMSYEPWHVELAGARGGKGAPSTVSTPSAALTSPEPLANRFTPQGPAPAVFGDVVGQTPVRTVPIDPAPSFGDLLAGQMQARQRYRQEQDQREAADRERRAALFGGGPFGVYR